MNVLIAGDFAPRARLAKQIEKKRFKEIFSDEVCKVIKSADFSFVNFESPIIERDYKPIPKCGPNLYCTQEATEAVKFAGFTGVTLANNHILDYGTEGLRKTIECCKAKDLDIVGVGDNLKAAEKILYIEKKGKKLAVINCCEHEFSVASETEAGANPLNPVRQFYAIQEAKKNADYVLVIVHGGHELFKLPSPRMVEIYRFFIDIGADAVVNHHQHCYSGHEVYNGRPIFYGLGNFCFDVDSTKVNTAWNYGYMVELKFADNIDFQLIPYNQYGKEPTIKLLNSKTFNSQLEELNEIIVNRNRLNEKIADYYRQCESYERSILEPYSGRVFGKLFFLGFLPKFIKGKKASVILNHIDCEAHRDKMLFALKRKNR